MAGKGAWWHAAKVKARGLAHGYRSGLEEVNAARIESKGQAVLFETFRIGYVLPQTLKNYTPDFALRNSIIVETKGIWDATDRAKHLLVKQQYPGLDIRIVFTRSKTPINPGSPTSYADWCRKYGIKFADKLIPDEWFDEPGPAEHYLDVIARGPAGYEALYKSKRPRVKR